MSSIPLKINSDKVLRRMGYKLGVTIGEGSYSKVKLATSQRHNTVVAIKVVDGKNVPKKFLKDFLPRELDILRSVRHEHIVLVHEIIKICSVRTYIVMEALPTDLLKKIKEDNYIPVAQAKTMFSQIVSAVHYLHQNNIVHRDMKCENVLLTGDNQVKITDFGFGRIAMGYPELSRTYCGSAAYAPPEVLLGVPYDAKKYDVWSLGVILYVMITGCMPYDDSNITKLTKEQRKPLVYPGGVTVEEPSRQFLAHLLQFIPSTRPTIQHVAEQPWLQLEAEADN